MLRKRIPVSRFAGVLVAWLPFTLCLPGCTKSTLAQTAPPPEAAVVTTTPVDATRSLIHFLKLNLEAAANKDRPAARAARDQAAWHLADHEAATQRYRTAKRAFDEARVMADQVENWAALVAYYIDGLDLDAAAVLPTGVPDEMDVAIPAHGQGDEATLRVQCRKLLDGTWRVMRLAFTNPIEYVQTIDLTPAPASRPATTQP